jgi:hypothetical protein
MVVDALETVEVDEQDAELMAAALRFIDSGGNELGHATPVIETREPIPIREAQGMGLPLLEHRDLTKQPFIDGSQGGDLGRRSRRRRLRARGGGHGGRASAGYDSRSGVLVDFVFPTVGHGVARI